jgi:hypothetical protein
VAVVTADGLETVPRPERGQEAMMEASCTKHPHEAATGLCRRCGHGWCSTCLVFAHGPKKPAYCMSCAMVAGGVKSSGALPAMPKRQLKAQMRAMKAEAKAEAKAAAKAAKDAKSAPAEAPDAPVLEDAACSPTDWATPWWEDREPTAIAD